MAIIIDILTEHYICILVGAGLFMLLFLAIIAAGEEEQEKGKAYLAAATFAKSRITKQRYSRLAVLADEDSARILYCLTIPDAFSKYKPLEVFKKSGVNCVFYDYYYPSRYEEYLSRGQRAFCRNVLRFKDGRNKGIMYLNAGIKMLQPGEGTIVMFMPCSTEHKYRQRFSAMAHEIAKSYPTLVGGFDYVTFRHDRPALHKQSCRANATIDVNYAIADDVTGHNVIVVDDILTTGQSLATFKQQIENKGGQLVGAIFVGMTFQIPTASEVRKIARRNPEHDWNIDARHNEMLYGEDNDRDVSWTPDVIYDIGKGAVWAYWNERQKRNLGWAIIYIPDEGDSRHALALKNLEALIEESKNRKPTFLEKRIAQALFEGDNTTDGELQSMLRQWTREYLYRVRLLLVE